MISHSGRALPPMGRRSGEKSTRWVLTLVGGVVCTTPSIRYWVFPAERLLCTLKWQFLHVACVSAGRSPQVDPVEFVLAIDVVVEVGRRAVTPVSGYHEPCGVVAQEA